MSNLTKITPMAEPYATITWQVNNFCNFQCTYCNPGNWAGSNRNNSNLDTYMKNVRGIFQQYQDKGYKYFKIFYSGGEPTHWENFIPLTEYLKDELGDNLTVAVNTNLSRPVRYWEKHCHLFDDIVASFHVEFCKKDRYIENAQFLCNKVDYLCTKMLMHEERFWEVVEFGKRVKAEVPNYNLEWTPLFDEMSVNAGPWQYKDPDKVKFLEAAQFETKISITKQLVIAIMITEQLCQQTATLLLLIDRTSLQDGNALLTMHCLSIQEEKCQVQVAALATLMEIF
jgi:organic radical activating enzyme